MRIMACMNLDMFRLSLGWALESLGHQLYYVDEYHPSKLEQAVQTFQPEMILDMGWDVIHIKENAIESFQQFKRRYRIFHVYFAEEDHYHFERWSKPYVARISPNFVFTRFAEYMPRYQEMGMNVDWLDVGCNPLFHKPLSSDPSFSCEVSVAANGQFVWDIFRRKSIIDLVSPLFEASFDTRIWGRDWNEMQQYLGIIPKNEFLHGFLPYYFTPLAYNSSKINISLQTVENQISSRTYDILSSGGFLLTSDTPAVRELLQPGHCCVISSSPKETVEIIQYYLAHEDERREIAQKGLELARNQFAYQKTIHRIWHRIENECEMFYKSK